MALERAVGILSIKGAIARGVSASTWIAEQRKKDQGYRRQTMLADFRSVKGVKAKTGLARFVRKDFRPTAAVIADVSWDLSREYMHKVKVHTRTKPGEPLQERFVNLMQDRPLTPNEVEQAILELLPDWQDSIPGIIERVTLETVLHRMPQ